MYLYYENMSDAMFNYLKENCGDLDQDHWFEEMELSDEVTGNASGSYFCNREIAKRCVLDNIELLQETVESLDTTMRIDMLEHFIRDDWEYMDVMIRLYLFPHVFSIVWEEFEEWFKQSGEFNDED